MTILSSDDTSNQNDTLINERDSSSPKNHSPKNSNLSTSSNCHNSSSTNTSKKATSQHQQNYNPTNLILDFAMNVVNEKEMTNGAANSPCSSTESEPKKPQLIMSQQELTRSVKKLPSFNNRKAPQNCGGPSGMYG